MRPHDGVTKKLGYSRKSDAVHALVGANVYLHEGHKPWFEINAIIMITLQI